MLAVKSNVMFAGSLQYYPIDKRNGIFSDADEAEIKDRLHGGQTGAGGFFS